MHGRVGVVFVLLEESGPWGLADADFPHTGGAWWGSIPSSVGARRAIRSGGGLPPSEARLAPGACRVDRVERGTSGSRSYSVRGGCGGPPPEWIGLDRRWMRGWGHTTPDPDLSRPARVRCPLPILDS